MTTALADHFESRKAPVVPASLWSTHLRFLAFASLAILVIFWRDAVDMVRTWWTISTYNHCLLIVPILYWLVQQRREELAKLRPEIWLPGLFLTGIAAFGWLMGEAAGVALARHLGLLMMLQGAVVTLLGPTVARGLIFPMAFSFFLVPFGEEFVPFLQMVTAKLSMAILGWADIPAFIDGIFISTPTGYFRVAEACSGIEFLIAMIAYGALVSNVCFQSWSRRILFMIAAFIVPILANGVRAFGTIYIAHHTSLDFAVGFDHIFYGWFFFAFVLILLMAIGWPFYDRKIDDPMIDGDALASHQNVPVRAQKPMKPVQAMAAMGVVVLVPVLWISVLEAQDSVVPDSISLPNVAGWERVDYQPLYPWQPRFDGASHQLLGRYRNVSTGMHVDLSVAVYDRQEEGREIVGYGQGALVPETGWSRNRALAAPVGASAVELIAPGPVVRDVVSFYRIGGKLTGSGSVVKIETVKSKLFGGPQQAVAILLSSETKREQSPLVAINAFLDDLGPVDKVADAMAGLR
ncbi:exosortase A [Sphingorhabdus sp. 109]|jgi:exosortase A|uniref:exosortase A n=1 Tax=Sphingorhabdus sp. 109 TaxID=2653173 RepID=UPI0012F01C32|nr:exosortase A [Sphingorhabdus sp. 109]VWX56909.1 Transmembrane exosortase (Exosortase_EpsH) [Sphingorhabdus sp. 109]